jgi:1-acyl-sn-glycerol-3-phosphate acyltransferase
MREKKHLKLNYISQFLRSLLFSVFMIVFTIFYSLLCVMAFPLPLRIRYQLIVFWTGTVLWALKKFCRIDYKIEGLENIPKDRNGVVLCKHQSTWETFFLPGVFDMSAIILKRELLWVPFWGWGLATIEPIAIDRKQTSTAMQQIINKGKKCLVAGRWILVFPEGTRIPSGKVGRYHLGGARLAVATHYPVIPVAHNAGRFWPRRRFLKMPGTVHVSIGPLIETEGLTPEAVMAMAKDWIENKMLKIDG